MSEIALYRKYRPKKLKGIVGQDHIKQYFQNAVSKNKISHAYLLSGTRGVGKTTIARIISLIVNCENGPSLDYDIKSKICSAILDNGAAGDVVELDAATNSSIDNIREIRKQAMTYPVMCRKRIFIIDECLPGNSSILLSDGRLENIKNIVESDKDIDVVSYNFTKNILENKRIVRKIKIKNDKIMKRIKLRSKNGEIKEIEITENHSVFLDNGEKKRVKDLQVGEKLNIFLKKKE